MKRKQLFHSFLPFLGTSYFMPPGEGGSGEGGSGEGGEGGSGGDFALFNAEDTENPYSFNEGWQEHFGVDPKEFTQKNLNDVLKSAAGARTKIGELTTANADLQTKLDEANAGKPAMPKTEAEFFEKLSLPEAKDLPEGVSIPDDWVKAGVAFAIEKGYPPEVVSDFIQFQITNAGNDFADERAATLQNLEVAKATITQIVGPENYENTISDAEAANKVLGLEIEGEDLIQNPRLVIALSKIKDQLSPGALKAAGLGSGTANPTAEGYSSQADDILTNPENPHYEAFHNAEHPDHEKATAHYNDLIFQMGRA
jgi:hypothetical protein